MLYGPFVDVDNMKPRGMVVLVSQLDYTLNSLLCPRGGMLKGGAGSHKSKFLRITDHA